MAVTLQEVKITVTAEVDKAIRQLQKAEKQTDSFTKNFKSVAKAIAGPAAAGLIIKSLVDISKKSSQLAARAEEVRNKFKVVFGESAGEISDWASTYSEAVGRSETDTLAFLGTIGDTLKPLGFTKDAVDDLSQTVVELAGDLGSFNDLPTADVVRDIQSAIVGNTETLRKYGVVASQAAIEQEAINSGISETGKNLTAVEKAQAILNLTLAGTVDAQGDLIETQDSATNVQRALNSELQTSQELYGSILNEALTPIRSALKDEVSEINKTVKAWILRNKVLAGEATLVEALVSKQNEREAVEEKLAQAIANVEAAENQQISTYGLSEIQIERINLAKAAAIEKNLEVQRSLENEILSIDRQEQAIKRQIAAENAKTDAAIASTQATSEKNEEEEKNIETTEEYIERLNENIVQTDNLAKLNAQLRDSYREAGAAATESGEDQVEAAEGVAVAWQDAFNASTGLAQDYFSAFDQLATASGNAEIERLREQGATEEEIDAKKRELARDAAKRQKVGALFGIAVNTAGAIMKGFEQLGPVGGAIAAAAIGGLAAVQTAAVLSEPLPALAEGGSFTTNGPTPLLVGDNPGGQETVTVEPVSSNGANVQGGMNGGTMRVVIDFGGGKQLTGFIQNDIDNGALRRAQGGRI